MSKKENKNEKKEVKFPVVSEQEVFWGEGTKCENFKAIVNEDSGETYYIGSPDYKLVQHEEAIAGVQSVIDDMEEFGKSEISIELSDNQARMEVTWTFKEIEHEISNGDKIHPSITVRNSYDGGWAFTMLFGAFRLVCSNGLTIGDKLVEYKKKHTEELDLKVVKQMLKIGMEKYSDQVELWKGWVDKVLTDNTFQEVKKVLTQKEFSDVMDLTEISSGESLAKVVEYKETKVKIDGEFYDANLPFLVGTMNYWIFMNILTQYITHELKSKNRQIVLQNKLNKIL